MEEIWKAIPGYEGHYEASTHGRIRSVVRQVSARHAGSVRTAASQVLRGFLLPNGYRQVPLCRDGVSKKHYVQRLVLMAFQGLPEIGEQARHWDNDRSNNAVHNLSWGTQSDNEEDKRRHGTHGRCGATVRKERGALVACEV